jgi:hypothetical protein
MEIINRSGKVIYLSDNKDIYSQPYFISSLNVLIVYNKKTNGVIDLSGAIKIPFKYTDVNYRDCGYFDCYSKKRVDYWNSNFKQIEPPDNSCPTDLSRLHRIPKAIETEEGRKYGWYDYETKTFVRKPVYDYTGYYRNGYAMFAMGGEFGFVDENFKEIIPAKYRHVGDFDKNGLAAVKELILLHRRTGDKTYQVTGYIDIHGTEYWED